MPELPHIRIKPNYRLFPLLPVLLLVLELVWPERVWMMLLVGLVCIWLLDFLWVRSLAHGLRFQRELRFDWAHVGDELEERFTLTNDSWAPAFWVEIVDASTLPDYQANVATGVEGRSENGWRLKHVCTRRGLYTLGPTVLRSSTPFGLYRIEFEYRGHTALMVMPPIVPLPDIEVAPGGRAQEGRRHASTLERTVSAIGIREYRHGDPYKTIHWHAVAHYNDLMVRTFESTPAGDWWIWLDLDEAAQTGTGESSTVEHAVILTASLASRGLSTGRAVGLVANAHELVWMPPRANEPQRLAILRALALVEPGQRTLSELLGETRPILQRNASVIFITPNVRGDWLDAVLALVLQGASPTVLLLDRSSFGGDGETAPLVALLAEWNIPHFVIHRDMLGIIASDTPREGHWDWSVGATGRAIPRTAPRDESWRALA